MKNLINSIIISIILLCSNLGINVYAQKQFKVTSPDGKITADISVGDIIKYSVSHNADLMLAKSPISIMLADGSSYGKNSKFSRSSTRTVNQTIDAPIYKRKTIIDNYNQLTLQFKDGFDLLFRAYNDGVVYRFISKSKKPFEVKDEQAIFNFPSDQKIFVPYVQHQRSSLEEQFYNSFENTYQYINLSQWDKKRLAFSPLVVEGENGKKIAIVESDLINYPGMFLYNGDASNSFKNVFAPYPKEIKQGGHNMLQVEVQSREGYIAKYEKGTYQS